eukprot:TRINITY_DN79699_c0_g1_i1.p1 TRINITY_DN79699_c0_g1~~TRINITY_DN79699_c0_g1_i1.p1  ORF type:complete len:116 (-),score=14.74 TRINITY_DN79699_c0_g1_i1:44-391(-)
MTEKAHGYSEMDDHQAQDRRDQIVVPEFDRCSKEVIKRGGAKNYRRCVMAWQRITRISPTQQGLVLFFKLKDRAWVDAETIDMARLGSYCGFDYFVSWIKELPGRAGDQSPRDLE